MKTKIATNTPRSHFYKKPHIVTQNANGSLEIDLKFPKDHLPKNFYPVKVLLTKNQINTDKHVPIIIDTFEKKTVHLNMIREIVEVVAQYFGLTHKQITRKTNKAKIVRPRAICYYFFYMHGVKGVSLTTHAQHFSQTHDLLNHHYNSIKDQLTYDKELIQDIENIKILINKYTRTKI